MSRGLAKFPALAECFRQHRGIERSVKEAAMKAVPSLESLGRPVYAGFVPSSAFSLGLAPFRVECW